MRFRFKRKKLVELYSKGKGKEKYPQGVFRAFIRRMGLIRGARDERDLRALKGAHFEKLEAEPGIYSMKLDKQYRLKISFEERDAGEKIVIVEDISKHYGD